MSRERKRLRGRRVPGRATFAIALVVVGAAARGRRGAAGQLLGRRPAGDADRRTVPAAEARRGRQRPHPDRLGRGPAGPGRRARLVGRRRPGRGRRAGGHRGAAVRLRRPDLGGRRRWCRAGGAKAPKTLPVKTGAQRTAWTNFLKLAVGPLRARTAASGPPTRPCPKRPIRTWQIWNEENFKYFVARPNPADYGKLVKISYAAIKSVDPGAKIILGGLFARPKEAEVQGASRRRPTSPPTSSTRCTKRRPGSSRKFSGVALHPYTEPLPGTDPRHRRSARRAEGQSRRRQGPLDHRARLELRSTRARRTTRSPKGARARRPS